MSEVQTYITREEILKKIIQLDKAEYPEDFGPELSLIRRDEVKVPLILVSTGTPALIAGAGMTLKTIREYISERNLSAEIIETGCTGMNNAEPMVSIQLPGRNRLSFAGITTEKAVPLLDDVFHNNIPSELLLGQHPGRRPDQWKNLPFFNDHPFFREQKRIVLRHCGMINPSLIDDYIAHGGYRSFMKCISFYTHEEVCDIIELSGLRGRSGSGYPTGKKWKAALHTSADQKYIICNAEEGDPGAYTGRALMEGDPFLLLEGISIASYAINATRAIIYIRTEYTKAIRQLENAIEQAKNFGLLGHNIFESGFRLDIQIRKGPGAFICGEETALINSLEGRRGMPMPKPPYPAVSGLHKKPTVINNIETLCNVPVIIEKGPKWFTSTGTAENYGTKVFTISGNVVSPGLVEVPLGTEIEKIIMNIAGGPKPKKKIKAVHIGGPSGCTISVENLRIPLSFDDMKKIDAVIGGGGIIVYDDDICILDMARFYMDFMKRQSCGKCIPCREGTRRMSEILESITRKPVDENGHTTLERFKGIMQLESLAVVMRETSLCGLGRSAPNPVISTLRYFREEYEEHIFDRKCRSGICNELRTYYIDVDACTGCALCTKKCPSDAIFGTPLHPHFIVEDRCTGCGLCYDSCKFGALFYK